jgi:hypothetical protein
MLGNHKKKNPEVEAKQSDDEQQQAMIPRELPPLRTFVVRKDNTQRVVEAHGLAIDEERMISFVVFFWLDPGKQVSPAQTSKLVLNANAWDEVEEINPLFPTLETH